MTDKYALWLEHEKHSNHQAWASGYLWGFIAGILSAGTAFLIGMWLV